MGDTTAHDDASALHNVYVHAHDAYVGARVHAYMHDVYVHAHDAYVHIAGICVGLS